MPSQIPASALCPRFVFRAYAPFSYVDLFCFMAAACFGSGCFFVFCCLFDYYIVYPGMRQPVKWLLIKTNFKCKRTGCTLSQFQNNTHQPVPFSYVRLFYLYCLFYSYFSCLVRSFVHKSKIIFHYPSYSGT